MTCVHGREGGAWCPHCMALVPEPVVECTRETHQAPIKAPPVLAHTAESLVALLIEMLQVPPIDGQSHTSWIAGRAANISQTLLHTLVGYDVTRRELGAMPLVFLDDITERIPIDQIARKVSP